ncbi:MAG TPA: aminopeptidase P family protein [Syntrophobacteraceae bacterium]|nr:aminopeptidase P family protein [Syntrophobacteraceae bacterium]
MIPSWRNMPATVSVGWYRNRIGWRISPKCSIRSLASAAEIARISHDAGFCDGQGGWHGQKLEGVFFVENVPMSDIAGRIVSLQALLNQNEVDLAVIRQNADLFYFAGTVQDAHLLVPASGQPVLLVRRDLGRAETQSPIRPLLVLQSMKDLVPAAEQACAGRILRRIGMELDVLPASSFFYYDEKLFPRQQIVDISNLVRQVRMVKSPWELEMMRGAAAISKTVAEAVPSFLREGITELELSAELERVARTAGHLGLVRLRSFNMDMYFGHILSGPDAAVSSYADAPTGGVGLSPAFGQGPSLRRIARNEVVSVDTMLNHNGYLNDQTRNFAVGQPPVQLMDAYQVVREIHAGMGARAIPGAITGELYDWVWQEVTRLGWQDFFMGADASRVKFIGHGLGVEVDELPFIAQGQSLALQANMTFAFEPKFIIPGVGITGLENTYVVTHDGLESLNTASEELTVV